jgi:hypothetical protein
MVYKPGCFHSVVGVLSWFPDATKNLRVLDKTTYTSLFVLQLESLQEVHIYISTINFPKGYSTKQQKKLVLKALLPFTIIDGKLYK